MLKEYLNTLANAFRSMLGTNEKINAQSFPEKITEVYNKGVEVGKAQGGNTEEAYSNGFEAGKQAGYDRFWDTFQKNGEEQSYSYAFMNDKWNDENYNPKYNLLSTTFYWSFRGTEITDTKVNLILTSNAVDTLAYAFNNAKKLKTIRKLKVFEETQYSNTFISCSSLENITFEGEIGQNISLKYSPLTYSSIINVITHLKDLTGTNLTRTLTLGSTNLAKLTDTEKAIATQKGWTLA